MLSGDNGILQKATTAKTKSDEAQIIERIKLAYHSTLAGGQGSYTKESLEDELEKEFGENNYNVDDSNNTNWILSAQGQSVIIPAGATATKPLIHFTVGQEGIPEILTVPEGTTFGEWVEKYCKNETWGSKIRVKTRWIRKFDCL